MTFSERGVLHRLEPGSVRLNLGSSPLVLKQDLQYKITVHLFTVHRPSTSKNVLTCHFLLGKLLRHLVLSLLLLVLARGLLRLLALLDCYLRGLRQQVTGSSMIDNRLRGSSMIDNRLRGMPIFDNRLRKEIAND